MRGAGLVTMGGSPCLIATSELDRLPERRVGRKLFMSCSPRYGTLFLYMPGSSFRRRGVTIAATAARLSKAGRPHPVHQTSHRCAHSIRSACVIAFPIRTAAAAETTSAPTPTIKIEIVICNLFRLLVGADCSVGRPRCGVVLGSNCAEVCARHDVWMESPWSAAFSSVRWR